MKRTTVCKLPIGCLLAGVALGGCDGRELVAPPPAPLRPALTAPVPVGAALLPPPPTTSGEPGPTVTLGTVPANTWVVIEVSGQVTGIWNPACSERPPAWPCPDWPITSAFEGVPSIYGPVVISSDYWGQVALRGTGGGSAIGVFSADRESSLSGWLRVNSVHSWDPNFGVMIPSYHQLGGGYSVTATAVPSPFRVTESAPDESGTITYTAEPLYGLKFINPPSWGHLPPGDLVWKFFPGDSLSDTPDFSWPGWYMYHCERKLVCSFHPPGPGRMQVSAFVEGRTAYVRSKRLTEPNQCTTATSLEAVCSPARPTLQVACSPVRGPDLVRGDTVDCVSTVTPAQEFTLRIKQASGDGFAVADTPNAHHAAGEADHWRGIAVANTRVKVIVEITENGQVRRLDQETRYTVSPRQWDVYRITNPTVVYGLVPGGLMSPAPDSLHHTYGAFDLTHYRTDSTTVTVVDSGPNRGLAFYRDQIPFDENGAYIWIHPALFPPSAGRYAPHSDYERWYHDQNGRGTGTCTSAGIAILAAETARHEGVTLADTSHLGVANRFFVDDRLDARFERLYRVGEQRLRNDAFRLYRRWKAGHRSKQDAFDISDRPKVWAKVGCTLDLFVNDAH